MNRFPLEPPITPKMFADLVLPGRRLALRIRHDRANQELHALGESLEQ